MHGEITQKMADALTRRRLLYREIESVETLIKDLESVPATSDKITRLIEKHKRKKEKLLKKISKAEHVIEGLHDKEIITRRA